MDSGHVADYTKLTQSYPRMYAATGACRIRTGTKIAVIVQKRIPFFLTGPVPFVFCRFSHADYLYLSKPTVEASLEHLSHF